MSPATDSAGQPFEGRAFTPNPHAGDAGECDPELALALDHFFSPDTSSFGELVAERPIVELLDALRGARVLAPLMAEAGGFEITNKGALHEKSQELSVLHLEGPDGRPVSPIFSSVSSMIQWNPAARPIPVSAPQAALAAASDGLALLVLNPGTARSLTFRRGAIKALATGDAWVPAWDDPEVVGALRDAVVKESDWVTTMAVGTGDPGLALAGPEVLVTLSVQRGLEATELHRRLAGLTMEWGECPVLAERVDGIGVKVLAA
jgi:hypothetical protein